MAIAPGRHVITVAPKLVHDPRDVFQPDVLAPRRYLANSVRDLLEAGHRPRRPPCDGVILYIVSLRSPLVNSGSAREIARPLAIRPHRQRPRHLEPDTQMPARLSLRAICLRGGPPIQLGCWQRNEAAGERDSTSDRMPPLRRQCQMPRSSGVGTVLRGLAIAVVTRNNVGMELDLYRDDLGAVAASDLHAAIEQFTRIAQPPQDRLEEGYLIDFKQEWGDDTIKSVAAFANTFGGILLVGVTEQAGRADRIIGVPAPRPLAKHQHANRRASSGGHHIRHAHPATRRGRRELDQPATAGNRIRRQPTATPRLRREVVRPAAPRAVPNSPTPPSHKLNLPSSQ